MKNRVSEWVDTPVTYLNKERLLDMMPDEYYDKVKKLNDEDIEEIAHMIEEYILDHYIIERYTRCYLLEAERKRESLRKGKTRKPKSASHR